jgi:4-amino-4-deoxy-L-arabinose transferase-like glycosyltransferase
VRRDPGRNPRDIGYSFAVAVVALLPRLYVAIAWAREPVWDGHYYHFGAERIARGLGYSEDVVIAGQAVWKPWCHYPVGYSGLLGVVYRVFGSGIGVAPVLNALFGTLLVVVVHRLGLRFFSETRARVAAALAALHPGLIAYSAVTMTEITAALLIALGAAAWLWLADRVPSERGKWGAAALSGVVLGLAVLVRPSTLMLVPFLGLLEQRFSWRGVLRAGAATLVAIAVVLPWTIRNCRVMDGCALVSTNGGWNLAIGSVFDSGRFETLRGKDGCPAVTGQVQQDRCWGRIGRERILAAPGRWLSLMPKKLGHTWDHESFAIEYVREANPGSWPEERRVAGRQLTTTFHRLLLIAGALGAVAWVSRREADVRKKIAQWGLLGLVAVLGLWATIADHHPFYWLAVLTPIAGFLPLPGRPALGRVARYLFAVVASTSVIHAVFFGDDRYHLVTSWAFCLLAAAMFRHPHSPTPEARMNG